MTQRCLIISHADADGHLIAEQVRRNLDMVPTFSVSTVVDPARTGGHKVWTRLDRLEEIESSDIVFFVDLMFAPTSFAAEADALVDFVSSRPAKRFFVLDHHPLPNRRLRSAKNLRALYKRDVLDCTIGSSSWLMILAALLEKQPTRAKHLRSPRHDMMAQGVRRAAALGGPLPGEKLLALLRFDRWDDLLALGREDASSHRLPRGRRPMAGQTSRALEHLDEVALALLSKSHDAQQQRVITNRPAGDTMSYDFETASDKLPPSGDMMTAQPDDLEAIVVLLELAAITLTSAPESTFSVADLLREARELGGDEIALDDDDVKIVLRKASFLKKQGTLLQLK